MKNKLFYWDIVSEVIGKLFISSFDKSMHICEIGFASGHFLEFLYSEGYLYLTGIEIRTDEYKKTLDRFKEKNINIELINDDVLNINRKFNAIFSTGLIQCLNDKNRDILLKHLSDMADIAIYTVPELKKNRNENSIEQVGVAGCKEFLTGNIAYELSKYYAKVQIGRIDKKKIQLEDNFIYFICRNT